MVVAETDRPVLLIETGVTARWYIPPGDVAWAQLEPVPTRTTCQHKGEATYFRVPDSQVQLWTYRIPTPRPPPSPVTSPPRANIPVYTSPLTESRRASHASADIDAGEALF